VLRACPWQAHSTSSLGCFPSFQSSAVQALPKPKASCTVGKYMGRKTEEMGSAQIRVFGVQSTLPLHTGFFLGNWEEGQKG